MHIFYAAVEQLSFSTVLSLNNNDIIAKHCQRSQVTLESFVVIAQKSLVTDGVSPVVSFRLAVMYSTCMC